MRTVTDAARETARMRAAGYLATLDMSTGEVAELAGYHARRARFLASAEDAVSARMLATAAAQRWRTDTVHAMRRRLEMLA